MSKLANKSPFRWNRNYLWLGLVAAMVSLVLVLSPVVAQKPDSTPAPKTNSTNTSAPLIVGTRAIPPFVFSEQGKLSGFSIDLWNSISKELGREFKFVEYPSQQELFSAVESNKVNLGIAAISITAERQKKFDFSLPVFASGLQILVRTVESNDSGLPNIFQLFFSPTLLKVIGIAIVLIVIAGHIVWLSERGHPSGIISKSYFPGIFKACWWASSTLATQADEMPKGIISRIVAVIWMFIGVLFVAYFTANATTSLTVQQLQGDIKGVSDLPGKLVVTTRGSTSAAYLQENHISVLPLANVQDAFEALEKKKADAMVFDAPILLYYSANQGKGKVNVVGSIFREENYGIILPNDSLDRKPINNALLTLKENGTYQNLYDKWFEKKS